MGKVQYIALLEAEGCGNFGAIHLGLENLKGEVMFDETGSLGSSATFSRGAGMISGGCSSDLAMEDTVLVRTGSKVVSGNIVCLSMGSIEWGAACGLNGLDEAVVVDVVVVDGISFVWRDDCADFTVDGADDGSEKRKRLPCLYGTDVRKVGDSVSIDGGIVDVAFFGYVTDGLGKHLANMIESDEDSTKLSVVDRFTPDAGDGIAMSVIDQNGFFVVILVLELGEVADLVLVMTSGLGIDGFVSGKNVSDGNLNEFAFTSTLFGR